MPKDAYSADELKAMAKTFDENRAALVARCVKYRDEGKLYLEIATLLNNDGLTTKMGCRWIPASVGQLLKRPHAPVVTVTKSQAIKTTAGKKKGVGKNNDKNLSWAARELPHLEAWRLLGAEWVRSLEDGVPQGIQGVNAFLSFLNEASLPGDPIIVLRYRTRVPNFYQAHWGTSRTKGNIQAHNQAHYFLEWVLSRHEFCEEDDEGVLQTSPAFSNPIPLLSVSGVETHSESVRPTLPYGYIDELRKMIAEGPNFSSWKWAQKSIGALKRSKAGGKHKSAIDDEAENGTGAGRIARIWFEVDPKTIDKSDPDCVWRTRERVIRSANSNSGIEKTKTVYEMWSPVRWVALLIKLQLPLRTFQVRMLDSGEADTLIWQNGQWTINENSLALGSEKRPYSNGVFLRPSNLIDGAARVLLHINTNKSNDIGKHGSAKGYNVPWIVGGPQHQDPFYWLEKLRRWQSKYNPIQRLTKWNELDGRHLTAKSDIRLNEYPDTAFLFRTPETPIFDAKGEVTGDRPDFPISAVLLDRPWFRCLEELQRRLGKRGEVMPNGQPIRLIPDEKARKRKSEIKTFFSLHSLRVSLITALAIDGKVPLVILQKIAGHCRLIMTLYYCKPGAEHMANALQAGVQLLNDSADLTILDWMATTEYNKMVEEAIVNCPTSLRAAVAENLMLRSPAGWMPLVDGMCLVGGNNIETEAPGCHNGGRNIGNTTSPRYAPVVGGARNCPMCRWFVTRPYFLPQLAARWNNLSYHSYDAREQVIVAEGRLREIDDRRAAAFAEDLPFTEQKQHNDAQRAFENAMQKFDELVQTLAALTNLMEKCRAALTKGDGTALMAVGGLAEFEYSIDETESELLQISGVCEGALLYPDLNPGKAVLRQSQLLDAALMRDNLPPVFLTLTENEQHMVGSAYLRELSSQMNPKNPGYGRYQIIATIDAFQSISERLGIDLAKSFRSAVSDCKTARIIPIKSSTKVSHA